MPALDSDTSHYALSHRQTPQQSYNPATTLDSADTSLASPTVPHLPAYAYTPPSNKRPLVSTNFDRQQSPTTNGHTPHDDNSPDPHEFYRRHRDPYGRGLMDGLGQADIRVEKRDGNIHGSTNDRPSATSPRSNGPRASPMAPRMNDSRYASSPTSDRSPLGVTKSTPALSSTARNRQTSLQDLVNKFNQTPDEVPPLPQKAGTSRSTSRSSNRANSVSRSGSQIKNSGDSSGSRPLPQSDANPAKGSRFQQRRGRTYDDTIASPRSKRTQKNPRPDPYTAHPAASQSMLDLAPSASTVSTRPLFGEVLEMSPTHPEFGYGIPKPQRRRGSEGSMHSPNPMFPDERWGHMRDASPSSPTAWYHGAAPTLEEIKAEKDIPEPPLEVHRRTRSDFQGIPSRPPASRMYGSNLSPPSSPTSAHGSRRNSQSRIPISTRRLSMTSDSGNSPDSTRNNSAQGSSHMKTPARTRAAPPRPLQNPRSPPRGSRSTTPLKSPRYGQGTNNYSTSPRLNAYISAPMPKKSPPLRSSRPRQPVSSASTSASRARAVERFSGHENKGQKNTKESRPRKPPELGTVDFAARRQKIQQAFTKTVEKNEREEERRASMARNSRSLESSFTLDACDASGKEMDSSQHPSQLVGQQRDSIMETVNEDFQTPAEELPRAERELTINTGQLSEQSVLDLSMEDSPTLGTFTRYTSNPNQGIPTPPSDVEPGSAVTAGTSGSVDTFFEDEPEDVPQEHWRHERERESEPNLLKHIMKMRSRSPSPTNHGRRLAAEDAISERDDRESIQIMLGDTPVLEKGTFRDQYEEKLKDPPSSEGPEGADSRWSMSSWTSSTKSKDEKDDRDSPLERIDEHFSPNSEQPTHLSISTSMSDHTQQAWSPAGFSSPKTARTTMDSDAYSTINRVLDHYHDLSLVSPDMLQDLAAQSPELARQGGWDSKKVMQLYLQQLTKERNARNNTRPEPPRFPVQERTSSLNVPPAVSEKEVRQDMDEKMVQQVEHSHSRNVSASSNNLEIEEGDSRPARASLSRLDDFDMSPSLGGFELQAADSSPAEDERPQLPPKDYYLGRSRLAITSGYQEGPSDRNEGGSGPLLPPIQGLGGLEITVEPPHRYDSPKISAPPLPAHSPPPLPAEQTYRTPSVQPPTARSPPLPPPPPPIVYNRSISSTNYPVKSPLGDAVPTAKPNQTREPRLGTPSKPSIPLSTSQDPEPPPIPTEATVKPLPSPEQKRLTRRKNIIKELVDTEHSFGQDMKVVDDIYKGTSNVIIISAEDVKTLFNNSDQIVSFSTNFLDALKQASKPVYVLAKSKRWRSNRTSTATSNSGYTDDQSSISGPELSDDEKDRKTFVGEAFANHMEHMERVYAEYLKNHDLANQKLQVLQKNPKVQIWLKECKAYASDLTSAWNLDSLLVKPVQRILKYPLLLDQLLEVTPENHPDWAALDVAAREMKGISMRINEMKKRADIMEQVTNTRKRKESDVRIGLSKAFGRRTEKLRQQVGLSGMVEDKAYTAVSEKFGSHFIQVQVVMRDVEMYTNDVQIFMSRFCDFVMAMEAHVDVGQTSYPEVESKWRKFRMSTREMSMTALADHIAAVRKNVIEPITTLLKLHDGPQKLIQKRDKRVMDYARFKAVTERGDKPDKKTTEQGEQFVAVNDTLKDELPKLFALTGKLVKACLNNFVQLQLQWQIVWRRRLGQAIDDVKGSSTPQDIIDSFLGDFTFFEAQVTSLGICNGSLLNDTANLMTLVSPAATNLGPANVNGNGVHSPRQAGSIESKRRTLSSSSDKSPLLPQPDFGGRGSGSFFAVGDATIIAPGPAVRREPSHRMRASSTVSGHSPRTPEVPGAYRSYSNSTTPVNSTPGRPSTATTRTATDPSPTLRPSMDSSNQNRLSDDSVLGFRPSPGTPYTSQPRSSSPNRYSGFFSSAMPMSDSPPAESPTGNSSAKDFNVIFLAASVYEFNIDRARKEAGYPYLTYVAGEIFDVIGEKGELWLAKNQDDRNNMVGWIWNKHFVKLAG